MSEPSLGQREPGKVTLLDVISLDGYEPDPEDVERVLGIEKLIKDMKDGWLNTGER